MDCEEVENKDVEESGRIYELASKRMKPDTSDDEFERLLCQLADRLKIIRHPDSSITIKAAKLLIEEMLSSDDFGTNQRYPKQQNPEISPDLLRKNQLQQKRAARIQHSKFNIADVPLPKYLLDRFSQLEKPIDNANDGDQYQNVDSGETQKDDLELALRHASKALKLLYLDYQKQLQHQVNETILSIQSLTAYPKTDSKLLATGREI